MDSGVFFHTLYVTTTNAQPMVWYQCSIYRWRFKSVCKFSSSEDGKKQNQSVHTHCISENFQSGTRKKG